MQIRRKPEDTEQRKQCWGHPGCFHDALDKRIKQKGRGDMEEWECAHSKASSKTFLQKIR